MRINKWDKPEKELLAARYHRLMAQGEPGLCYGMEQKYGLDGYPPELCSVGFMAIDEGKDPDEAIDNYINKRTV